MGEQKNVEILLVEDNEGDIILTREAFKAAKVTNTIHVARDGEEAMDFLHKRGNFEDAVTPDIILLDLNLPKKDGRQTLQEIKDDENLRRIPVVIMTSSKAEEDIVKTYNLHANCYVSKPVDMVAFINVVNAMEHFWFNIVTLPQKV